MQGNEFNSATFLMAEIESSILILKDKVKGQKRKTHVIHGFLIILGALITLVLGLKIPELEVWQKNIALILGALLTIVSSWNAVFDYKKLWIRQKSTLLDLYQLKNEINYKLTHQTISIDEVNELFDRYQEVWERDGNEWRNIIYKKKEIKTPSSSSEIN